MQFHADFCAIAAHPIHFDLLRHSRARLAAFLGTAIADDWPVFDDMPEHGARIVADPANRDFGSWFGISLPDRILFAAGGFGGRPDESGEVIFGYALARGFRGRGLGLAFATSLVRWAFAHAEVFSLRADTLEDGVVSPEGFDNRASCAVLRRLGFACVAHNDDATQTWRLLRTAMP